MKISMVGTGYVGLVTGTCLANMGHDVVCLDVDQAKIDSLNRGDVPIYEPGLRDLIERNVAAGRLGFTSDPHRAHEHAQVIFICAGTPSKPDGSADISHVLAATEDIAMVMEGLPANAPPKVVVVKSTVPVGTSHQVDKHLRSRTTRKFYIANNPEFLKQGAAIADFTKPDRVICGVDEPPAGDILRELYEPFVRQGNPIQVMDVRSSEMVKYASNAMLACKISFINEMANLCELYGADINSVREGMCADVRIGKQFLYPGLGYGGSCFPKDTQAIVQMGQEAGLDCRLNAAVHEVNQQQRRQFWCKIDRHFHGDVRGRTFAFWGVAFKPETDDIREAPSITLMEIALQNGASVQAYDPVASKRLAAHLPQVRSFPTMYDALDGCDALVVCTEWSEFRQPDFDQIAQRLKQRVIFDGRNIYRRSKMQQLGFTYYSVGRAPVNGANLSRR